MNIPLDRLYYFLKDITDYDVIIYRYTPHGSKKIEHCLEISPPTELEKITSIPVFCHDQEPLDSKRFPGLTLAWHDLNSPIKYHKVNDVPVSFYKYVREITHSIFDETILVHSEKQSKEVSAFEKLGHRLVYYWNHAFIAKDWYRYAEYDPKLRPLCKKITHDFLIYNRAWAGTREYRLKFAELAVQNNLVANCKMKFSPTENDKNYNSHTFKNPNFAITTKLENYFDLNDAQSSASADYVSDDYNSCAIEVVLETLFDDTRWHLTEKTLRPIACGQPFILCATAGSLEYLHSYGFKTFGSCWDESYDLITDPVERLNAVIDLMSWISRLDAEHKNQLWAQANQIAQYNRHRFFSKEFDDFLINEFKENFKKAAVATLKRRSGVYYQQWKQQHLQNGTMPLSKEEQQYVDNLLASINNTSPVL